MIANLEAQKAPVSQPVSPRRNVIPAGVVWQTLEDISKAMPNPEDVPGSVVPTQPSFSRFNI